MPDDWYRARLLIREAPAESEAFIDVAEPFNNKATGDFIEPLPEGMLQAIEDLYLYFFSTHRHWIECLLELKRGSSGALKYSATFCFFRNG